MSYIPLPRPRQDPAHTRLQHELLRFVRDAAAAHAPLPGELELTARLGCSRQQLRNAMSELERQGILRRRQGAVTTVDPIALRMSVRLEEQYEHSELLDRLGFRSDVDVLGSEVTELPASVSALMELPAATRGIGIRKRWRADGAVAMVAHDVVPIAGDVEFDPEESVFTIAARVWGEPVIWEVSTPGVAALDASLAELFERPVGTPVMTLEFVGIGASGRRLLYSIEHHDPDVVSYSLVRTVRPPWNA
ncbi:GntR family transcriptional regulator [Microbacterium sp. SORGH_AS_0888]|uniref:GntR family transcriptional regulator n=1 Tax=Microbacterium sp. SORGH_AS_0888 TaxID=3041791 RepID=UPI00278B6B45|nr:GntR family transcriptional regulator [Microbacterium sp. SORGH_AS_0888]MDQ1130220.1 GntR family transcriptional regulator [Microbacterium sp. SORGH_AS_0888]